MVTQIEANELKSSSAKPGKQKTLKLITPNTHWELVYRGAFYHKKNINKNIFKKLYQNSRQKQLI